MKKAVIFLNGQIFSYKKILKYINKNDFIVCANGGSKHTLKLGLIPHAIIGDFDSLPNVIKKKLKKYKLKLIKYPKNDVLPDHGGSGFPSYAAALPSLRLGRRLIPRQQLHSCGRGYSPCSRCNKDKTDSELALDYVVKKGFKNILIFGALGKRLDHFLSNLYLLANTKYEDINLKIINQNQEIFLIKGKKIIKAKKGDLLSLIPLKEDCLGIYTKGLLYKLNNEALYFSKSRGVSNVFTSSKAEIKIKKGILLAIHTKADY